MTLLSSANLGSHLKERLAAANQCVKLKKCQFGRQKAHYLGHDIGQGKIEPDKGKVEAVTRYPTIVSKKDVRSFLGYYRRFVPAIATPLTEEGALEPRM